MTGAGGRGGVWEPLCEADRSRTMRPGSGESHSASGGGGGGDGNDRLDGEGGTGGADSSESSIVGGCKKTMPGEGGTIGDTSIVVDGGRESMAREGDTGGALSSKIISVGGGGIVGEGGTGGGDSTISTVGHDVGTMLGGGVSHAIFVEREEIKGATSISTEGGECKEVEAGEGGTGGGFSSSTPVPVGGEDKVASAGEGGLGGQFITGDEGEIGTLTMEDFFNVACAFTGDTRIFCSMLLFLSV